MMICTLSSTRAFAPRPLSLDAACALYLSGLVKGGGVCGTTTFRSFYSSRLAEGGGFPGATVFSSFHHSRLAEDSSVSGTTAHSSFHHSRLAEGSIVCGASAHSGFQYVGLAKCISIHNIPTLKIHLCGLGLPGCGRAGAITNTASATAAEIDPSTGDNTASQSSTVTPRADLSVTKADNSDPVQIEQQLTYTISVS